MTHPRIATVFGGSGFIGRHVVQRLVKAGYIVRVPSRDPAAAGFLRQYGSTGQVVPMFCLLKNEAAMAAAVQGADLVVNLLGILYETRRATFEAIHVKAAAAIAKAAAAAKVGNLVHVSAIGASSSSTAKYARSKAAGEAAVREAFSPAIILRPSVVFGPEDNFFNMFAGLTRISPFLPLIGGGKTRFQPVYVGDVAEAVLSAANNANAKGLTFELGGPTTHTFKELLEYLLACTHRQRKLLYIPFFAAKIQATFLGLFPKPLLTRDQVELLRRHNVVQPTALPLESLGITPTPMDAVVPQYLARFIPQGA